MNDLLARVSGLVSIEYPDLLNEAVVDEIDHDGFIRLVTKSCDALMVNNLVAYNTSVQDFGMKFREIEP